VQEHEFAELKGEIHMATPVVAWHQATGKGNAESAPVGLTFDFFADHEGDATGLSKGVVS
jgi:hypothetical protein